MMVFSNIFISFLLIWQSEGKEDDKPKSPPTSNVGPMSDLFMVQLTSCTGSLIAKNWVLTAAHCVSEPWHKKNDLGDYVSNSDSITIFKNKIRFSNETRFPNWTDPLSWPSNLPRGNGEKGFWQRAEQVIYHGEFKSEALSWKGFDIALLKLGSTFGGEVQDENPSVPICLAAPGYNEFGRNPDTTFMAGYGRREVAHCITNDQGPEVFEVCARPMDCSYDHRTRSCGISFNYKNKHYTSCVEGETPSAHDPICSNFRAEESNSAYQNATVHIIEDNQTTTCYPEMPPGNGGGWCVTRAPGVDEDEEPTSSKGWGFCSDDESQKSCNTHIRTRENPRDFKVDILTDKYCVDMLEANLKVEQPDVPRSSFDPLLNKSGLICIGRNHTKNAEKLTFEKQSTGKYTKIPNPKNVAAAESNVNGGPSCFGDSGGPLWQKVKHNENEVPVLIGVFSFMLWGTCTGRADPGYYVRVSDLHEWIQKYIPKEELCSSNDLSKRGP